MKKLLFIPVLLLVFTTTYAQDEKNPFRKNEISLAPYGFNYMYFNSSANDDWLKSEAPDDMFLTNYRRWLNENTALRFGGNVSIFNFNSPLTVGLEGRVGVEKYLSLFKNNKWQLYGGGELQFGVSGVFNEDFSSFGIGVAGIGGLRYNFNNRWSLSSEVITPLRFGKSTSLDLTSWSTGVQFHPVKVNFRF